MPLSPLEYLRHIRDETVYLIERATGVTKQQFLRDETLKRAFVRSIEIIGEAAKHLPPEFTRQQGQIDWRAMAGMRDEG